jgi:rhamnosyl/mannosyltransferase
MSFSRSITVCHVYKTYLTEGVGGLEKVIEQICSQCDPERIKHRILTLSRKPEPPRLKRVEAEICRFPVTFNIASSPVSISMLRGFRREIKDVDILHYHFPWPFGDLLHMFVRPAQPALVSYHSDILRQKLLKKLYSPLMRHFLNNIDRIVVASPNYLDSSVDLLPYRNKTMVIPYALDEDNYPVPGKERLRYWKEKVGDNFYLFVGVLRYYKGLSVLFDAIQNTRLEVVIVGNGPMGNVLHRRKQAGGFENVTMTGYLAEKDKMALLRLCRAIVFPSHLRTEAFGITLLEGAMAGKPLISAEIGTGTTFVNKDGETGLVVPPSDSVSLRHAMEKLKNNKLCATMGKASRKRYEQVFSAPAMGEEYTKLYKCLMNDLWL